MPEVVEGECSESCRHETVCENKGSVTLDCGDGVIDVITASYGRTKPDDEMCPYGR